MPSRKLGYLQIRTPQHTVYRELRHRVLIHQDDSKHAEYRNRHASLAHTHAHAYMYRTRPLTDSPRNTHTHTRTHTHTVHTQTHTHFCMYTHSHTHTHTHTHTHKTYGYAIRSRRPGVHPQQHVGLTRMMRPALPSPRCEDLTATSSFTTIFFSNN